ncbi:MAG: hypothetical protein ACLSX5_13680 [Lachnospiraceae bacterium]
MKRIYANLIGNWTDISDGLINEEKASVYVKERIQDMLKYDYVNIFYKDKTYRIHPSMIQIVNE